MFRRLAFAAAALASLGAASGCSRERAGDGGELRRAAGATMGSYYEVRWRGGSEADVRRAIDDELQACERCFSTWRDDTEIGRCNAADAAVPFAASARFAGVLRQALAVAAATDGAFDPTVLPLSMLYRLAKSDPAHAFADADIAAARARVGHRAVTVDDGGVHKARADVALDLDGIAAGACVDAIAHRLQALGVVAFCIDVTGEVLCRGERAPGEPWQVGIGDPRPGAPPRSVALRDRALCTSGIYANAVVAGGRVLHHVFDPRTGRPVDNGVVCVSVLAPGAALADALATAFLVLGPDGAARVLPALRADQDVGVAWLVIGDDGELHEVEDRWLY